MNSIDIYYRDTGQSIYWGIIVWINSRVGTETFIQLLDSDLLPSEVQGRRIKWGLDYEKGTSLIMEFTEPLSHIVGNIGQGFMQKVQEQVMGFVEEAQHVFDKAMLKFLEIKAVVLSLQKKEKVV